MLAAANYELKIINLKIKAMNKAEELVVEKVSELCQQIIKLQTENDCLKKENDFLKTLILKQNGKEI